MRVDVDQPRLDVGDAAGIRRMGGLLDEGRALEVGRQYGIDQAPFAGRRFLRHRADAGMARHADRAGIRHRVAEDQPQQRRLADAVAADKPHLVPARDDRAGSIEDQAAVYAVGQLVDVKHGLK